MTEIKVGEKYLLNRGMSSASNEYAGETVTVSELHANWCYIEEHDTGGVWLSELEPIVKGPVVKFQRLIEIKNKNIAVRHTTNSKKGHVSFTGYRQAGHIHIEDLDKVIEMLQRLKKEV